MVHIQRPAFLSLLLASLAACGGGGSSGSGGSPIAPPSGFAYAESDLLEPSGVPIAPLAPTVTGEVDAFEVQPALPPGLVLDPATGELSGTPLAAAPGRVHIFTARNAGGSASFDVRIEIAAAQRFAIVANGADASLATLAVDAGGAQFLRGPLTFAPASLAGLEDPVAHPGGRFVYTTGSSSNVLAAFAFDTSTGALEARATLPLAVGPHAAAVNPAGTWLAVACRGADTVHLFSLDAQTGVPTLVRAVPVGDGPADVEFARDGGSFLVVHTGADVDGLGSSLARYEFDVTTGATTLAGAPLGFNGGRPNALVLDPRDEVVYVSLPMFDSVLPVRFDASDALVPVPPLVPASSTPESLEVDARGRYLHVALPAVDTIRVFAIQPGTFALSWIDDYPAGDEPVRLQRDALGQRVHAVARGSRELLTLAIEPTGALTAVSSIALRSESSSVAIVAGDAPLAFAPRFVHCANEGSDDVHAFEVDPASGALAFRGQAFTNDRPVALAVDARGRRALVVGEGARTVQGFEVAPVNGVLTGAGTPLFVPGTPNAIAIDPTGRFAYVTVRDAVVPGDGFVLTISIDAVTGDLTLVDQATAGVASCAVAVDPSGEYLYVANAGNGSPGSATIHAFRLDPGTGVPTPTGSPAPAPGVTGLALHPDARNVYAVLRDSDALARYAIDRASGNLSVVPPAAGAGLEPSAVVVDPRGRFAWAAYTGNAATGQIDVLPIAADGALQGAVQSVLDGAFPTGLSLDRSGRFLFAANRDSHDLSVFAVDAATGLLAAQAPAPAGTSPRAVVATGVMH